MRSLVADRRAVIFCFFALLSLLLVIPCPTRFHYVGFTLTITYIALGTASWLDSRLRTRPGSRE
jgi:hypothetical protein